MSGGTSEKVIVHAVAVGGGVLDAPGVLVLEGAAVRVAVDVGIEVAVRVAVASGTMVGVGVGPEGSEGRGHTYAPRLRVHAERVVWPASMASLEITALGRPALKRFHTGEAALILSV